MKHKGHLISFIWIFLLISSCNKISHIEKDKLTKKTFHFMEIGRKDISEVQFPDYWNIQAYSDSEAPPMTKEALYFEEKLNDLDYFDSVKGRLIKTKIYNNLLTKKNQKIDSLFVLNSISNKDITFVYIKSYKTENGNYEIPPTFQDIDLLIFSKSKFKEKVNIYSYRNYPYAVGMRLGYLNNQGDLFVKEFETDEEKTTFVKEEHIQISEDGNVKLVSSVKKPKIKNLEEIIENTKYSIDWKGHYTITTKAISRYDNQEIDLLYSITVKSNDTAILSIGADSVQDYGCEGSFKLTNENDILHAKGGKCDPVYEFDFFLKKENGKYYIKSKQFLNPDWQILKKDL